MAKQMQKSTRGARRAKKSLSKAELAKQQGSELPNREAMSLVNANLAAPINAAVAANVLSDNSIAVANAEPAQPPAASHDAAPQAQPEAEVADPPERAPGVQLSEAMEESAFVEPQWLVQRDGTFIQLTELLYRVVENIDGQRSLEEIAE